MTKIKMMMLAVLALALAVALPAHAQDTSQPSTQAYPSTQQQSPDQNGSQPTQQPEMTQPAPAGQPGNSSVSGNNAQAQADQTLSGTISADGKTFNSNGTTYTVSNPNSVQAYANQPITVGYEMGSNNSIRITKVMLTKPQQ
jgi:opacity protein-like surface antigen